MNFQEIFPSLGSCPWVHLTCTIQTNLCKDDMLAFAFSPDVRVNLKGFGFHMQ